MAKVDELVTSNVGRYKDYSPHLRAAGKVFSTPSASTAACMREDSDRPATPPHMYAYRKSYTHLPGQSHKHPGKFNDPEPPGIRFGVKNDNSDTAETLVHPLQDSAWTEQQRDFKESIYRSNVMEPVGKSRSHGYNLPDKCRDPNFRFGSQKQQLEGDLAKLTIYPIDECLDKPEGRKNRKAFDWDKYTVDPLSHRFGFKPVEVNQGGAAAALKPDNDNYCKAVIVKKAVEDFRDRVTDELAKPKKQWGITAHLPSDYTFGQPNKTKEEWGARECLRGHPTLAIPDDSLGKSTKRRNYPEADPNKVFGVPTVRYDRAPPAHKRVTNYQNWGDEPHAGVLLYPSRYADVNVHEDDFLVPMDRNAIGQLCEKAGFNLNQRDFDSAWNLAATYTKDGSVCLHTFQSAMDELALPRDSDQ